MLMCSLSGLVLVYAKLVYRQQPCSRPSVLTCQLNQALCAGLGFAECTARVVPIADDELTANNAYLKEHEHVQTRGWVYYAFNVTDEDYQIVVNVAEEEGSQCKLRCLSHLCQQTCTVHYACHTSCLCMRLPVAQSGLLTLPSSSSYVPDACCCSWLT